MLHLTKEVLLKHEMELINLGECAFELLKIMQQKKGTRITRPTKKYLNCIDDNVDTIFSLHLNSGKLTIEQIEEIKQKAT